MVLGATNSDVESENIPTCGGGASAELRCCPCLPLRRLSNTRKIVNSSTRVLLQLQGWFSSPIRCQPSAQSYPGFWPPAAVAWHPGADFTPFYSS
jgi:hypothetical protein